MSVHVSQRLGPLTVSMKSGLPESGFCQNGKRGIEKGGMKILESISSK